MMEEKRGTVSIDVDERLLDEAFDLSSTAKLDTREKIANQAILEFVERRRRLKDVFAAFGTIEYDEGYDYKKARRV